MITKLSVDEKNRVIYRFKNRGDIYEILVADECLMRIISVYSTFRDRYITENDLDYDNIVNNFLWHYRIGIFTIR